MLKKKVFSAFVGMAMAANALVTMHFSVFAVDDVPEPTAAPIITDTAVDNVPEPTAVPIITDTAVDDVPKSTTAPVTADNTTTTETTVVTTSIPIVTSISPIITSLYQRAYHLDIRNLPNKTDYNIGDKLDLTGLTVDLRYNDESNRYYNTDYINAYPPDYPDVFTIDTSEFDNSKTGTYTIEISCKYEAIHWYPPLAYFEVTVNYPSSVATTTPASTTDITTTETTVVTTQIPKISTVVYTTPFTVYESAYVHSLKSPPDRTVYEIGDELDLTGLKVDLEFYDQHGGHHTVYRNAYPPDNPDFIVDTSDFDNSKAGTYKIKVSCADKFTAFYLPGPVYFEVTVNDPNSASTTTPASTTDITTTETTVTTETGTEQTTAPTTDTGDSVTTETSTVPPTTTVSTETKLPQTGYPKWYRSLIAAAMGMIGVGTAAIVKSGILRKKESNS
ncbi:MAG: bacterial Ig-like domain-containing protein [Clostridium sp.]|nr:bacterial Ig-like domain-containing protein [Clostridium sp.]